uniref:RING-type domain-containing protein n=1 Tax=Cajanus cajan TaxID=3821 RepID=A0A151SU40_CAJCA|nr:hypothetical protein KK1_004577 [Cajanus cajan]
MSQLGLILQESMGSEREARTILGLLTDPMEGAQRRSVSLMRLLEETENAEKGGGEVGNDSVCCVCMGKKKGAAFIPCGHTFCRVCSRELWLKRGTCPLCNRSILDILHIF